MPAVLKHTVIYLFMLLVVTTTGGIGFLHQGCVCEEKLDYYEVVASTDHQECADQCCPMEDLDDPESCDTESEPGENPGSCPASNSCCYTFYSYYKTDVVNLVDPVKNHIKYHSTVLVTIVCEQEATETITQSNQAWRGQLPPLPYGKDLLTMLHMLKYDPLPLA